MAVRGGTGPPSVPSGGSGNKKKEVKKASYYVWFLGAKESQGLRGESAVRPALDFLLDQERQNEPSKVTLQVSNKGMKILQNVAGRGGRGRPETIKHFIPRDAITWVVQEPTPDDDLIATILLLYNPATRCPVHVHAYRCDSVDTATMLRRSLEILVERPEQQRRLASLESGLAAKGTRGHGPHPSQQPGSDGRSTRGDSESSGSEREFTTTSSPPIVIDRRTAHLYANLAAELREKLGNNRTGDRMPLLLPPRDYDTMHRSKGKLDNIDSRRCMQVSVVGPNGVFSRRLRTPSSPSREIRDIEEENSCSSGRSSGIGSEEAPSSPPPLPHVRPHHSNRSINHYNNNNNNNHDNKPSVHHQSHNGGSSSDEEWEAQRQMHTRALLQWEKRASETRDHSNGYPHKPSTQQQQHRVASPRRDTSNHNANEWPRVLPRVQPRSPSGKMYQELPEEKRYPGLDRETARSPTIGPTKIRRPSFHSADKERPQPQAQQPARFSYTDPSSAYRFVYPGRGK